MKSFHSSTLFTGTVSSVSLSNCTFWIELLTKEKIEIKTSATTYYEVLRNIGDINRDRVNEPDPNDVEQKIGKESAAPDKDIWAQQKNLIKYILDKQGLLVCIYGIYSENDNIKSYSARKIVLMDSAPNEFGWEQTHWWVQQINTLFENWLDVLFQTRREFTESDFAEFYRTNLDLLGGFTLNSVQECATLSRFLYGLSSSYLLTGNERSLSAARACAQYIINAYANPTHDGKYVFWKFGRVKDAKTTKEIIPSQNPDDFGTYALYEQIYALSGLAQFYRITQDTWVLSYITRSIAAFNRFFKDDKSNGVGYDEKTQTNQDACYAGYGGYFSHLDPVTMRPDSDFLGPNKKKKNWNSNGDHIPAYLVNLIISLDPLPASVDSAPWQDLLDLCQSMLKDCVKNILDHFPSTDDSLFVNERFGNDWVPEHDWGWQKDRGIVGHNLKISWNLTRSAHYFMRLANELKDDENRLEEKNEYEKLASDCYQVSKRIGQNMKKCGVDLIRGGIFDALERHPKNGLDTEFAWDPTKDFWQQEQSILAYYIMQDVEEIDSKDEFLELARYCSAFWSLFFVDQDYRKIYFRTNEIGSKVIEGQFGIQAGHAIAGYHAFELCYLAHIYIKSYVDRGDDHQENFVLYFQPNSDNGITSLNVLPDFFRPEDLRLVGYKINGHETKLKDADRYKFQIPIANISEKSIIIVEYECLKKRGPHKNSPKNGQYSIQIPFKR
ncbi:hypothetical protein A4H97_21580 [Niastella yeongjuensis]|uniref:N-acyl-D-glucosamine 2-epimerase n=1 Tax=Niastella yeongjuensis TaxID=354355 RepID=A0A1V9F821_9BACT|nr:hypothetical protein [Niastella yeongjuensis]OQP54563.1 hypothetical protein A4H97_21580 [Niastella yeongjuensis]SEN99069.1 hypothetical protein SAMN05660816_01829 [Niastella yeongjuensis]